MISSCGIICRCFCQASLEEGGRVESFNIDRTVGYASEDPTPAGASTGESEGEGEAR